MSRFRNTEPEASFYTCLTEGKIRCELCPHQCLLSPGQTGLCRVRNNFQGKLYGRNYKQVSALALDPMEKKPLYHFYPGKMILSLGTWGCNMACGFCQNHAIAMGRPDTVELGMEELLRLADDSRNKNSAGVAFTYNEPFVWYDYILEAAQLLRGRGQEVVLVTNGYVEPKPLERMLPFISAMNIDLKSFRPEFYRRYCRGRLEPVLDTITQAVDHTHVELTTLLIPQLNDSPLEIEQLAAWVAELDADIPLHLSAYHPSYNFRVAPTPAAVIEEAQRLARKYLHFVYGGNILGLSNDTYCLNCGRVIIKRNGFKSDICQVHEGKCLGCGVDLGYIRWG